MASVWEGRQGSVESGQGQPEGPGARPSSSLLVAVVAPKEEPQPEGK